MRQSTVRATLTSLVVIGGMIAGAAPIAAQDIAPPEPASSGRGSYVAPPTTSTTLARRDVQAPPTTTIPSTPPTSAAPAIPNPPATTSPDQQPGTTIPGSILPPSTGPEAAPPSLPDDIPPDEICRKHPEACDPPDDSPPPKPDTEAPVAPPLPRDFAANDAGAVLDGLRIHADSARRGVLRVAEVILAVAGGAVPVDGDLVCEEVVISTVCWEIDEIAEQECIQHTEVVCTEEDEGGSSGGE